MSNESEIGILKARTFALERLVIELSLISLSSQHFTDTRKSQVSRLLDELQYAGLEPCGDCDPCLGGRPDQCAVMANRKI